MATLTPATLMGLKDIGDIQVGYKADLNVLDNNLNVSTTIFKEEIMNH